MKSTLVALASVALLAGCGDSSAPLGTSTDHATEFQCTATQVSPGDPRAFFAPFDDVEQEALCVLDTAEKEVLVAHYNIRRQSYLDKLVELADRGVKVKVVVDQANAAQDYNVGDDFLEQHGIDIVRVKPPGSRSIMHLKVTVIDGKTMMTGSFNWNGTAALANDENMVVLREPELVSRYAQQVLEVRGDEPHRVDGGQVSDTIALHFSPEERLDDVIEGEIDRATASVDVAMFTFTMSDVADALIRAAERGVRVRVVMETKQCGFTDVDERLEAAGAQLIRGANKVGEYSAMHQKYAVIDADTVITGATNWTFQGTRSNDEDLLILANPKLAARYLENFGDLLSIYGGVDAADIAAPAKPGALFHAVHDGTQYGDYLVVTGNHPALGNWDPWQGVPLQTSESMFPSWSAHVRIDPDTAVEYKFVQITASGQVIWEPGPNRVTTIGSRSVVRSGAFGDTGNNWTPLDPQ